MIRVVDYGVGNIEAFLTMFRRLGVPAERAQTPEELMDATRLILPGVGAFDPTMQMFNESGLRPMLEHLVLDQKVPVLGVCVGMQMMAGGSDEGELPGLNWIPGRVRAFASNAKAALLPSPHMGWNDLAVKPGGRLLRDLGPEPRLYFLHSFYFDCEEPAYVEATAEYGITFHCVVSAGNIHGVQCHPEKSHRFGAQLLKSFAEV